MALPVARNAFRLPLRPSFSCQSSTIIPSSPLLASSARSFSATSPDLARVKKNRPPKRPGRDRNPNRGVSILRRTGLRKRTVLGVNKFAPLPQPVLNPALHKQKVEVDKNHGLWDFFPKSKSSTTFAADEVEYGRHWSAPELRAKSWEDLHKLWWVVFKERGRIKTSLTERERIQSTHGQGDLRLRMDSLRQTQKHIKRVLTERFYAWEDARTVASTDQSVDLTGEGDGGAYNEEIDRKNPLFQEGDTGSYDEAIKRVRV